MARDCVAAGRGDANQIRSDATRVPPRIQFRSPADVASHRRRIPAGAFPPPEWSFARGKAGSTADYGCRKFNDKSRTGIYPAAQDASHTDDRACSADGRRRGTATRRAPASQHGRAGLGRWRVRTSPTTPRCWPVRDGGSAQSMTAWPASERLGVGYSYGPELAGYAAPWRSAASRHP